MSAPILYGLLGGFGLWCLFRGLLPNRRPLGAALEALQQPRNLQAVTATSSVDSFTERAGAWVMSVTNTDLSSLKEDLAVLERSEEYHLVQRVRTAAFYALPGPVMHLLLASFGVRISLVLVVLGSVAMAVAGWLVTDSQVKQRAQARREEFESALVTYLQLVAIQVAGGSGIDEAMRTANDYGEGWSFQVLRRCLTDARVRGVSLWVSMADHGTRYGLDSLVDLASTMELAGISGAHIRESLMAKARALRLHQINEIEREASVKTTAMAGPTSFMATGFVILVGYPAFVAILSI